ncbi:MAG: tetratricopeptide repeat protein [Aestuariibacter sp.]
MQLDEAINLYVEKPSDGNIKRAYKSILCLANNGNVEAKHEVFLVFYKTFPILKDSGQEAFDFLIEAANNGNADAQYNLGYLLSEGKLAEKNDKESQFWLEKASRNGSVEADFALGIILTKHSLIELEKGNQDEAQRLEMLGDEYMEKAAKKEHIDAMRIHGMTLLSNFSEDVKNLEKGQTYLEKAALSGDIEAMYHLGVLISLVAEDRQDEKLKMKSEGWIKRAAELGHEEAKKIELTKAAVKE